MMSAFDYKLPGDLWEHTDWNLLPEMKTPHVLVSTGSGADYYADGTADDVQIQAAIDGLTVGRTWMETVVVKGNFSLDAMVTLDSYTRLVILGKVAFSGTVGSPHAVLKSDDEHHIQIIGGTVSIGGSTPDQTIFLTGSVTGPSDCLIQGVEVDKGITLRYAYNCEVRDCYVSAKGIRINYASYRNHVHHNWVEAVTSGAGIIVSGASGAGYDNVINENYVRDISAGLGIAVDNASYRQVIDGNIINDTNAAGIGLEDGCNDNIISNNMLYDACISVGGTASVRNKVVANTLRGNSKVVAGIYLKNADHCVVSGNKSTEFGYAGIDLSDSDENVVTSNLCMDNGQSVAWCGIAIRDSSAYNVVGDNICYDAQGGPTQGHGIRLTHTADYNRFYGNMLTGNKTGCFFTNTTGTHNTFPMMTVPFINGSVYDDRGYDIDLGGEYAATFFQLPDDYQELIDLRIWAYSVVAEADAMRLEIVANGGASNEPYNTEGISVVDKASETTNFAADDIIYWELTSSDDADLGHLAAGDSVELKVLHEAAGGADCATDARFRFIELRYV